MKDKKIEYKMVLIKNGVIIKRDIVYNENSVIKLLKKGYKNEN